MTTEDVGKMQECVLKAYEETLRLEKEGKMTKDDFDDDAVLDE